MGKDAGYIERQATIDLTGTTAATFGIALTPMDIFEVGVVFVTAGTTQAPVIDFRQQATPTGSVPSNASNVAQVTAPAVTNAAGSALRKYTKVRINKGDKLWAVASTTTTAASDAIAYIKAYPAGEGAAESGDVVSTT